MNRVSLTKADWEYDPESPLGSPGGFGTVYRGLSSNGEPVALKRLHVSAKDSAHRELVVADALMGRDLKHIIPYLDLRRDTSSDAYFIVMPIADRSLSDHIAAQGLLTGEEAISVVLSIASALAEVPDLVHRDLKPSNVLLHQGTWKVADFGIARFVEESTSLHTLKGFLSPPYAAPEQWNYERASQSTDIYALGVITYQLLSSQLPFPGPTAEDFREQHLHSTPPPLSSVDPRLSSLVTAMLRKPPQARPPLPRILTILETMQTAIASPGQSSPGLSALSAAGSIDMQKKMAADAAAARAQSEETKRQALAEVATQALLAIVQHFESLVQEAAPSAKFSRPRGILLQVDLGTATLEMAFLPTPTPIPKDAFRRSGWDVVAGASVAVAQAAPSRFIWSASLWFTDLGLPRGHRWWEVCYMGHPLSRSAPAYQPFAAQRVEDADAAVAPGMARIQLAAKPRPIDGEHIQDFCDRWAARLAEAFNGNLRYPSRLPLE